MKQFASLPEAVQTLVKRAVAEKDGVGMSPAEVYKLTLNNDVFFLKIANTVYKNTTYSVRREGAVLQWLHGKLPVPDVALLAFLQNERQAETLAFSHGDLGGSNIFVKDGNISGFIDWGRGGVADVHVDISFAANSILEDLGDRTSVDRFLGTASTRVDPKKLRYFQLLDELF